MPKIIIFLFVYFVGFLIAILNPSFVNAQTACLGNVSPTTIASGSTTNLIFTAENSGDEVVSAFRVTNPDSESFQMSGGNSSGWSAEISGNTLTFNGGTLNPGAGTSFSVSVLALQETEAQTFVFEASSDGVSFSECSGGTEVSSMAFFSISGLSVAASSTGANISWTTSEAASTNVYYGKTSSYGLTAGSGDLSTSHSVSLTGLSSSTTYYYQVCSTNGASQQVCSSQSSFTTGATGTTTITTTVTNTVTNTQTNTVTKTITDTTPPVVRFSDEFKKIYEEAPLIGLKVTDGFGISRLEYTFDGKNYLPIDISDSIGGKTITTDFIPNALEDGDYSVVVRAVDTSGNKAVTKSINFTIDRLPPRTGPILSMLGPIVIYPDKDGLIQLLAGVEYKFILPAAGGPNNVEFVCGNIKKNMSKNPESGFWYLNIKFDSAEECAPQVTAKDGAGNIQISHKSKIKINSLGKFESGTITVYWYDSISGKFVVWDGEVYGQRNPVTTSQEGGYGFVLPPGKYYLEAKSPGKKTSVSSIIDTENTVFIKDDWSLSSFWKFWEIRDQKILSPVTIGVSSWIKTDFLLPKVNLGNTNTLDIRGGYSLVSLLSSWHPETVSYLNNLSVYKNSFKGVYPIFVQENQNIAEFFKRRGAYDLDIYADRDGDFLKEQSIESLPLTWIVDKFGRVVLEKTGIVKAEDITEALNELD